MIGKMDPYNHIHESYNQMNGPIIGKMAPHNRIDAPKVAKNTPRNRINDSSDR
jgi:hypothetical protein